MSAAPLVLLILDGWGYRSQSMHNAIIQAKTPHWDQWWHDYPHALLEASGPAVGLPEGQMGNSEVGHMHIGAGHIIEQDLTRIDNALYNGTFTNNSVLKSLLKDLNTTPHALHLIGLASPGGVHSHEKHLWALLEFFKDHLDKIYLHLFLDGRDTPPQSALPTLEELRTRFPQARVASITGRYYAMDRDSRWARIAPVYELLTDGTSNSHFDTPETALATFYEQNIFDEFIPPTLIGKPAPIASGDTVLFFNYRADRARQLTEAFLNPNFTHFSRKNTPKLHQFISMTRYSEALPTTPIFPPLIHHDTLGEVLSKHHKKQLRIAETEKYAHVTFFLNGGEEKPFSDEERILIPSPRVATYDQQPKMSAESIAEAIVDALPHYDVIIANFANADMVGHTGDLDATKIAISCLDQCMEQIVKALPKDGTVLITADHGNAEIMYDDDIQQPHTAHTCEPVPFLCINQHWKIARKHGSLIDIAPTVLQVLNIPIPETMTGIPLLKK
ncbi:MAG: 2,3-bisphosphoglycerate-independent phosphoglycerate mutase [Legionellaceae bacterium]|nr:2,3-bisphosphoglycerate-independent phosphoglycerate mutase [Legionellaceae bacterium]